MSTKVTGLPGLHKGSVSPAAGIRPYQLDLVYAATSDFQADKTSGTGGAVTSTLSAGDFYLNSGNNYSFDLQGASSLRQLHGVARTTITSAVAASAGSSITLATLVAAPGANRVVIPNYITVACTSGASATDGSPWAVCYGQAGGPSATTNLAVSAVAADGAAKVCRLALNPLSVLDTSAVNKALVLTRIGNVAQADGNATWYVTVNYDTLTISA